MDACFCNVAILKEKSLKYESEKNFISSSCPESNVYHVPYMKWQISQSVTGMWKSKTCEHMNETTDGIHISFGVKLTAWGKFKSVICGINSSSKGSYSKAS